VKTSIPYRWQALCGGDGHSQVTGCILLFLSIDEDQIQVLGSFDLYRKIGQIRNKSIAKLKSTLVEVQMKRLQATIGGGGGIRGAVTIDGGG